MRVVSLNLDSADAEALRQTVDDALAACDCQRPLGGGAACPRCGALEGILQDLTRFAQSPPTRSGIRALALEEPLRPGATPRSVRDHAVLSSANCQPYLRLMSRPVPEA